MMQNDLSIVDPKLTLMLEQIKVLFFEFGIKNLNMDDISQKLGISKKTLYRYVSSKEDLIARVFQLEQRKWVVALTQIGQQPINSIEKLLQVSLLVKEEMKQYNPMILFELKKYYENLFHQFQAEKVAYITKAMRTNLVNGIQEGLYRRDINRDAVVAIYMNNLVESHHTELCKMSEITFDELFRIMFENHIRAISTPEGVAYFENRTREIAEKLKNNNK